LGIAAIVPLIVPGVPGVAPAVAAGPESLPASVPESTAKCGECGVIESTREIATHGDPNARNIKRYETIVRLPDGSRRAIHDINPAAWRTGERVILIAGTR
jgi:hypothetical protein